MQPAVLARRIPWSIVAAVVLLLCTGWLGIARSEQLRGSAAAPGSRYLLQQVVFSLAALAAMLAVALPSYRILCRHGYSLFGVSLLLLVVVYFFPSVNGAHRWIRCGPIGFQPSEFAKVAFVVALAQYLMYRENYRRFRGLLLPLAIALVPVLLVLKEPDLGTAVVFLPVLFAMLFAAGARRGDLCKVVLVGVLALPLLWMQMSREQRSRVTALFDQPPPGQRPGDDAYHLHQAKRVRALGGVWGSLLTGQPEVDPAVYHLPEARADFIFCVLGERFGLPAMGLVLGLFVFLAWRAVGIATATREPFGRLLATGVAALLAVQVLINTGMTVGLLPITGLSLPLVSCGGSGLLANGIAIGLLLNVGARPGYEVTKEPFRYVVESG